jgi:hypothetical protein
MTMLYESRLGADYVKPKANLQRPELFTSQSSGIGPEGSAAPSAPLTAEEIEINAELDELERMIGKAEEAGGARSIIEALVSEVLKLKKRIQDLTAELEHDDDEFDEFGQKINSDGKLMKLMETAVWHNIAIS